MRTILRVFVLLLAAGLIQAGAPSYDVEIIPPLAGQDSMYPRALAQGHLIGLAASDPFDPVGVPVIFRFGTLIPLKTPTDSLNFVVGASKPALIAGSSSGFPVVWRRTAPHDLLPAGGLSQGEARDANGTDAICGAVVNDLTGAQFPAFWATPIAAGRLLPGRLGSAQGVAHAINEGGQIAGAVGPQGSFVAARWDDPREAPLELGMLEGGINSEALDLNEAGDCVGRTSFADGSIEAMLYVDATGERIGLGFLDGTFSFARAINDAGQIVGTASASGETHAFLWQEGVLMDLNDLVASSTEPFLYLADAVAIDAAGTLLAEAVVGTPGGVVSRMALLRPAAGRPGD